VPNPELSVLVDAGIGTVLPDHSHAEPVAGLADAVGRVLDDPRAAAQRAARARERLATDFSWARIASRTVEVYAAAVRRPPVPLGRHADPCRGEP
jgi:glycogen(starch) synthase